MSAPIKTEGCAGFQGRPAASCGVCGGAGCAAEPAAAVKECLTADVPVHPSYAKFGHVWSGAERDAITAHTARAVAAALTSNGGAKTANSASNSEMAPVPKGGEGGAELAALATPPASAQAVAPAQVAYNEK